jgi:hypothetical protein
MQDDVDEWMNLYPAVDVVQELRSMRGWCLSNPSKRKTKRGIKAFINRWLGRRQDQAPRQQGNSTSPSTGNPFFDLARELEESERKDIYTQ